MPALLLGTLLAFMPLSLMMNQFARLLRTALAVAFAGTVASAADSARQTIARAAITEDAAQKRELIGQLMGQADPAIAPLLEAWRVDALFIYTAPDGKKNPVQLTGEKDAAEAQVALRIDTGAPLTNATGQPLRLVASDLVAVDHNSSLRRAMKAVLDLADLAAPAPEARIKAIQTIGLTQDIEKLPALQNRLKIETDPNVQRALREAIAIAQLKDDNEAVKLAALAELKTLSSLASTDFLKRTLKEAEDAKNPTIANAVRAALREVENHRAAVDFFGTLFRGV
ncbi:MAG: hypothetical protein ABIQ12_04105, partial [Opitutaceae bacterium]